MLADAENVVTKANDKYVASNASATAIADVIILNKTDLLTTTELRAAGMQNTFPGQSIMESRFGKVPVSLLMGNHRDSSMPVSKHADHEHYSTWSFESDFAVSPDGLKQFVSALPATDNRAKGIARLNDNCHQLLQVVGQRKTLEPIVTDKLTTQLVAIGLSKEFDIDQLEQLADTYLRASTNR